MSLCSSGQFASAELTVQKKVGGPFWSRHEALGDIETSTGWNPISWRHNVALVASKAQN